MGGPARPRATCRRLKRLWDAPVNGLDIDALAEATDAVFLALPDHAAAEIAPSLVARGKRVFDLSGAFRLRDADLRRRWYPHTPDGALAGRLRTDRAVSRRAARIEPGRVRGLLSDRRDPRAAAAARCRAARRQRHADHHRREVGRVRRRQDADRADALQRVPRQPLGVRRVRSPACRRDRTGARDRGDVRAAPAADRSRHPRNDLRDAGAQRGRSRGERGAARGLRGFAVRPAHRRGSAGDQARGAHELLRHRLACARARAVRSCWSSCIDNLVKGAAGQAVQNFNVAFGFEEGLGLN